MSSAIKTPAFQAKAGNIQNQADTSAVYSDGEWSFKNSTAVARMTIKDDGKVGIGVDSPGSDVHVKSSTAAGLWLDSSQTSDQVNRVVSLHSSGGAYSTLAIDANTHLFRTGTTERMRIDASGNVGIGRQTNLTDSTSFKVLGLGAAGTFMASATGEAVYIASNLSYQGGQWKYINTASALIYEASGNSHKWFTAGSATAGTAANNALRMRVYQNGATFHSTEHGLSLSSFGTTGSNLWNDADKVNVKLTSLNNALSIMVGGAVNDRNANIQVGHESTSYATTVGSLYLNRLGGTVYANTTAISDKRYKRDLEKVTNALDKVNQLSGYTYYRTDIEKDLKKAGVVAQEVEKVLPEAVVYNEADDMYGVSYHMLSALYIEAIKELTDKNKELEARLAALEAK